MSNRVRHMGSTAQAGRGLLRSGMRLARWSVLPLALAGPLLMAPQTFATTPLVTIEQGRNEATVRWNSVGSEWGYKVAISPRRKCPNAGEHCRETQYAEVQRGANPQEFTVYYQNLDPKLGVAQKQPVYIGVGIENLRSTDPARYQEEEEEVIPEEATKLTGFAAPSAMWTEGDAVFWEGSREESPWGYKVALSDQPRCEPNGCRNSKYVEVPAGIDPQGYRACTQNIPFASIPNPVYVGVGALVAPDTQPPAYTGNEVAVTAEPCPPPTVVSGTASAVTQSTAVLNATVNPNGTETSACRFEYGTSTAYGASIPCSSLPGSGMFATAVSSELAGLAAGTIYHFRIVAEGVGGPSYGADQTVSTLAAPSILQPPPSGGTRAEHPLNPGSPPVDLVAPSISGKAVAGYTVTASPGTWEHGPASYAYQWQLCNATGAACENIRGAVEASLTLASADVGHQLRAVVTASNSSGSSNAVSPPSTVGSTVEAKIEWTFNWFSRYTIVEAFDVTAIPPGGVVEVSCIGRGCPFRSTRLTPLASARCHGPHCPPGDSSPPSRLSLAPIFRRRHLRPGTVITVRVLKDDWVGRSFTFTVLANHRPKHSSTCLAPGSAQPGQGC